jgi:hypothetical protein
MHPTTSKQTANTEVSKTIDITFGDVTASEIDVMLEASSGSDVQIAKDILDARKTTRRFLLTIEQAKYLGQQLVDEADRVSQGCSESAGRAFEKAGERLLRMI